MKKRIVALFIGCFMAIGTVLPLAACVETLPKLPVWDTQVALNDSGVTLTLKKVENASAYKIYHSPSRYGNYELVSEQSDLEYTHTDKYGYYRVDAMNGDEVISSELLSYDLETFGENTYVYAPTDDQEKINADINEKFVELEAGQFSSERFGVLFKKGTYSDVRMQMGYYTTVTGLTYSPKDVTLGYFNVNAKWFNGNATHNFWRGIENVTVDGDVQWAVSQATSFRRMNVLGNVALDDGGWSSGGYIADSKISGNINSGGQQQWFTRNSSFTKYNNGGWSRVFVGCEGQVPGGEWPSGRSTVIESAEEIREKPYLVFDESGYGVFIPETRENAKNVSWDGEEILGEMIPLDKFYVARADRDTSKTLNAALKNGKNLLLTPGIYELDEALLVEKENTVVTGIGLATLHITEKNTDTCMRVKDVDGVSISGILFDAGRSSETLLEIGEEKTNVSHEDDKIYLSDLYFRVGGARKEITSVDTCIVINSNDVICDHFWIWRADHSYGVSWAEGTKTDRESGEAYETGNLTKNGIVVNGDNVTAYALMVEHFHEYQTLWNGDNGKTYFYQSEVPYDPVQEDWSHDDVLGYASYKVADDVLSHEAYGVGVYYYQSGCILENAIEAPESDDVYFKNIFTQNLSGSKGGDINNVINGVGGNANSSKGYATVGYYYGGKIQEQDRK